MNDLHLRGFKERHYVTWRKVMYNFIKKILCLIYTWNRLNTTDENWILWKCSRSVRSISRRLLQNYFLGIYKKGFLWVSQTEFYGLWFLILPFVVIVSEIIFLYERILQNIIASSTVKFRSTKRAIKQLSYYSFASH